MNTTKKKLSARQHQILKLIAQGYTSRQISETFEISELTVQTHRRNMLKKMGFNNSQQLINWGYRERILKP